MRAGRASLLLVLACAAARAGGLTFNLAAKGERCILEQIPSKTLYAGDWSITKTADAPATTAGRDGTDMWVKLEPSERAATAADGRIFEGTELTGHFAITAKDAGAYSVCVRNDADEARDVTLNLKMALEVEEHGAVAKQEHIEAIEAELERMKTMAVHVYDEMLYMRTRADQQQATNESLRGRLLWVELLMMVAVLAMGLWQITYLRSYFKSKKII